MPWAYRAFDTFDRADGFLGANWTATIAGGTPNDVTVFNNRARSLTAYPGAIWTAATFGDDQFASAEFTQDATSVLDPGEWFGVTVRCRTDPGGEAGYLAILFNDGSGGGHYDVRLYEQSALTFTELGSVTVYGPGFAPTIGDTLKISAQGTTIKAYFNGVEKISVTNSYRTTGGAPGILFYGACALDNWIGGDFSPVPANVGFMSPIGFG
jgi:hypothetical protein